MGVKPVIFFSRGCKFFFQGLPPCGLNDFGHTCYGGIFAHLLFCNALVWCAIVCFVVKAKQMSEGKKFCCQTMTHTTLCHFGSSDCGVGH